MKKTAVFLFLIFSIFSVAVFAQNSTKPEISGQSKRLLLKAQNAFDKGDYSESLSICQDARIARNNEISWECDVISYSLNIPAVKKYGPFISDLIPILKDRDEYDSLEIIDSYLSKKGADFFDNSLPKLYEYIAMLKDFPESDFLLSKIYRIEGEYDLAMQYLEKARAHSDILDIPAQKYDILYEMADLANVQGNEEVYEKCLKLIIADDGLYKNGTVAKAIVRTVTTKRKGVDASEYFLQFFRSDALNSMKAYFALGDLCEKRGENHDAFIMTALGVIVGFTHTVEILDDRLGGISFDENDRRQLEMFFIECGKNEDVMAWMQKCGMWGGFYNLAVRASVLGYNNFAESFLKKLANVCPDEYWKAAATQLVKHPDSN